MKGSPVALDRALRALLVVAILGGCTSASPSSTPAPTRTPTLEPSAQQAPSSPIGDTEMRTSGPLAQPVLPTPPPLTASLAASLSAALLEFRAREHIPGVQVAVSYANAWTWTGRAGFADLHSGRRVSTTTRFDAGSITKTFVAALVLQLVGQGVLRLDDPLSRWDPSVPGAAGVTVRDLLDHTSGIDDPFNHPSLLRALAAHPRLTWTPAHVLAYVGPPHFRPGTGWYYSNANYLLLGQIVQAATGQTVATLLQQRFFGPLHLTHTFLQGPDPTSGPSAHGYDSPSAASWAATDLSDGTPFLPFTSLATALGTAGALTTTADDLVRWAQALYGGHVLSRGELSEMVDVGLTRGLHPRWPYGLGLQQVRIAGATTWGHSGLLSGFHAAMRYVPATGLTIAVLMNTDSVDPDTLVAALLGTVEQSARRTP